MSIKPILKPIQPNWRTWIYERLRAQNNFRANHLCDLENWLLLPTFHISCHLLASQIAHCGYFVFCFVCDLQKLFFAEHADIWNNGTVKQDDIFRRKFNWKKWNSNQFDWQKIKYNWFLIPLIYYLLLSEMSPLRVNWAYGCPHQLRVHAHYSSFVASYLCICVYRMYIYSPKSLRSSAKST